VSRKRSSFTSEFKDEMVKLYLEYLRRKFEINPPVSGATRMSLDDDSGRRSR
jgi:hypothetical protein